MKHHVSLGDVLVPEITYAHFDEMFLCHRLRT
jgi:hypothetical protein